MQFNVQRKQFLKALSFCQSIVEKKTAMPVLSHILLKARDGKLTIVGTDLDLVISEQLSADIQVEGGLCIPAALTYDIVKRLDGYDTLSFSYEDTQLFLRCGRSEFRLSTIPVEQFPDVSQLPLTASFIVDPVQFKKLIDDTRLCLSDDDEVEQTLHAIYLHAGEGNTLCCAGTDLCRLGMSRMQLANEPVLPSGLIVGKKAIGEIRRLIDDKVQTVTLSASAARIQCDVIMDDVQIVFTARLIDGIYPEYQKILGKAPTISIPFVRSDLLAALERVAVIVDERLSAVTFEFTNGLATITAVNLNNGSGKEEIEVKFKDDPFTIQFNAFYLLAIIRQLQSDTIKFSLNTPHDAVHIQSVGADYPHYVMMPLVT